MSQDVEYLPIPIFDESIAGISHEKSLNKEQILEALPRMEHDFSKGSVLWHCTEGKDRCGILSAVLLSAGKTEDEAGMIRALFLAKESYLEEAFLAIDEEYDNIETFLCEGLKISLEQFKKKELATGNGQICGEIVLSGGCFLYGNDDLEVVGEYMKRLYIVGGTMGVGKTAVCRQLKMNLPNSVFLDGDWCWDANPFQVTDETKVMVTDNICYLLNNFLHCSAYENVIFCWVMHQQSIIDSIIEKLDTQNCDVKCISLIADEANLRKRLTKDVENGIRTEDVIERSITKKPMYDTLNTIKIDTRGKTVIMVANEIKQL